MLKLRSEVTLGLEINDSRLVMAEVWRKGNTSHLQNVVQAAIPSEVMADGKVKQVDTLAEWIREHLRTAKIRSKHVHLVVPSQFVVIRQLQLPDIPHKKLRGVIDFELQNSIHLPFEDPIFDFVKEDARPYAEVAATTDAILKREEEQAESLPQAAVTLVASSRSAVDPIVESARKAGLRPQSVDIRALALARVYRHFSDPKEQQTILFVDVEEMSTDIHILHGGMLRFTRNVPMALDSYVTDRALTKPLPVLEILEFFENHTDYRSFTQDLVYEVERSVNFFRYTLNNREAALSCIVLTGLLPKNGHLVAYLQERMPDIPVRALSFEGMQVAEEIAAGRSILTEYAVPIGLALKEVK